MRTGGPEEGVGATGAAGAAGAAGAGGAAAGVTGATAPIGTVDATGMAGVPHVPRAAAQRMRRLLGLRGAALGGSGGVCVVRPAALGELRRLRGAALAGRALLQAQRPGPQEDRQPRQLPHPPQVHPRVPRFPHISPPQTDAGRAQVARSAHTTNVGGRVWGVWFPRWCLALCAGAPLRCCSGACFLAFDET